VSADFSLGRVKKYHLPKIHKKELFSFKEVEKQTFFLDKGGVGASQVATCDIATLNHLQIRSDW